MGNSPRPLVLFLLISFGLSIALSVVVGVTGGAQSDLAGLGVLAMLFPALAVLVVRLTTKARIPDAGWRRFPLRWLLPALFLLPVVVHGVCVPLLGILSEQGLPWVGWLTPDANGIFHTPAERDWGELSTAGLAVRILINAAIGLLLVSALAFFEEIGWRAWMLPHLIGRLGERRGVVVGALIWALWHVPFALSGIHHFEHVPLALHVTVAFLGHAGAGIFLGWLWLRTRSIWLVCLAHGALNNWGQYAFKFMASPPALDPWLLTAVNGTLFVVGAVLVSRLDGDRQES